MTLEIIDESYVKKTKDKEKKSESESESGLRFLEESEIKNVGSDKKSWSDIIDDAEVRKDPKIELVDKSDTRKVGVKKPELEFVKKERIVSCERQRDGMTNNCAICKELTRDRFNRCPSKYGGF
jgi:hypothetical protein